MPKKTSQFPIIVSRNNDDYLFLLQETGRKVLRRITIADSLATVDFHGFMSAADKAVLEDHITRLDAAESAITALQLADVALVAADAALDTRLDTAEADIDTLQGADTSLDGRLDTAESAIDDLQDTSIPLPAAPYELLVSSGGVWAPLAPSVNGLDTLMSVSGVVGWTQRKLGIIGADANTVGLWHLSAGTLVDSSGNGNTLTVETGTERYAYIHPTLGGFYFDGSTALWVSSFQSALAITGDMTFECLFILEAAVNNAYWFSHMNTGELSADNQLYGLKWLTAPNIGWLQENGAGVDSAYTGPNNFMAVGQICHLAVTRTSNVIQPYLNGRVWGSASAALTTPTGGGSGKYRIGGDSATRIKGVMANVRLSNISRSAATIKANYNDTLGPVYGRIN